VTFRPSGEGWQLSVADNGIGLPPVVNNHPTVGLGTTIVESLARQLDGNVRSSSSAEGTCVFVTMGPLANIKPSQLNL
jgi:two-component sensor histidine kinase